MADITGRFLQLRCGTPMLLGQSWETRIAADGTGAVYVSIKGAPYIPINIDRPELVKAGRGIITETFDPLHAVGSIVLIGGTIYAMAVGLRAGDVVTNLTVDVTAAGVALTRSKLGLYDKAGNLLGSTAELGAAWQTTGLKTHPLSAPFTILTSDMYYVAVISTGGTLPTMTRGGTSAIFIFGGAAGQINSAAQFQTGQTDLTNPMVFGAAGTVGNIYWMAVS